MIPQSKQFRCRTVLGQRPICLIPQAVGYHPHCGMVVHHAAFLCLHIGVFSASADETIETFFNPQIISMNGP